MNPRLIDRKSNTLPVAPPSVIDRALVAYHDIAEVETCAVVKVDFSADFNVYSTILDSETLENSGSQCSAVFVRYNIHFKVFALE